MPGHENNNRLPMAARETVTGASAARPQCKDLEPTSRAVAISPASLAQLHSVGAASRVAAHSGRGGVERFSRTLRAAGNSMSRRINGVTCYLFGVDLARVPLAHRHGHTAQAER